MNRFLLTMQYDESLILPIFLKHYSHYFPAENIFVIDHGSQVNLIPEGVTASMCLGIDLFLRWLD